MDELGEAAKLWVYFKMAETAVGLALFPFFVYFTYKKWRKYHGS